jgi:hypothetical protein
VSEAEPHEPKSVVTVVPPNDGLGREDRIALHLALRESIEEMKAGRTRDAAEVLASMRSLR